MGLVQNIFVYCMVQSLPEQFEHLYKIQDKGKGRLLSSFFQHQHVTVTRKNVAGIEVVFGSLLLL